MNKRPTYDYEIKLLAARKMAEELIENCNKVGEDVAEIAKQIADCADRYDNGYEIAKQLDIRFFWEIDIDIVQELDNFSTIIYTEIENKIKTWVKENDIQPPFPINTRIKLANGETGEITTIRRETAEYLIKIDGDEKAEAPSNRRRIVAYESVSKGGL